MSQANTYEQFMLELINAERAQAGAQPLAFDNNLNTSAEDHSSWMIATDTFSHTGKNGSSAGDRMSSAGYNFTGSWTWAENIAWMSTRAPAGLQNEVAQLHNNLMNSSGHRANLLSDAFREIGVGFEVGQFGSYEGAFVTQNFARTASDAFLTGVVFDDKDNDTQYGINEGLGGLTITAKNNANGVTKATTTNQAGGYELELGTGNYTVSFSGNGFSTTNLQTSIGGKNVKLDLIDPAVTANPEPTPQPQPQTNTMYGTWQSETLRGTSGNDEIFGLNGKDKVYGRAGNDLINGGGGNDWLAGGAGADILTGGNGRDKFVFSTSTSVVDTVTDFSVKDDIIFLKNTIFTNLNHGKLDSSAFYIGTQAHDATDHIIFNKNTGALYYDSDAAGGADAEQFAQLTPGLLLTPEDFYIFGS